MADCQKIVMQRHELPIGKNDFISSRKSTKIIVKMHNDESMIIGDRPETIFVRLQILLRQAYLDFESFRKEFLFVARTKAPSKLVTGIDFWDDNFRCRMGHSRIFFSNLLWIFASLALPIRSWVWRYTWATHLLQGDQPLSLLRNI